MTTIQPKPPPAHLASSSNGFIGPLGKAKLHPAEQVQQIIMSFVQEQQQRQQQQEQTVTVNPMEILSAFMSYFGSWRDNNNTSPESSGADSSDGVDLLSDEDVVNCFVILMHCIVRDRYNMEPVLFVSYVQQSIQSMVQVNRLQSRN